MATRGWNMVGPVRRSLVYPIDKRSAAANPSRLMWPSYVTVAGPAGRWSTCQTIVEYAAFSPLNEGQKPCCLLDSTLATCIVEGLRREGGHLPCREVGSKL